MTENGKPKGKLNFLKNKEGGKKIDNKKMKKNGKSYSNDLRIATANDATKKLAKSLLGYNKVEGNANDTVEVALVTFSDNSSKYDFDSSRTNVNNWTTDYTTFENALPTTVTGGTEIKVYLQANWNVRFTNFPKGTTYTIEESNMPQNFEFISNSIEKSNDVTEATTTYTSKTNKITSATIDKKNIFYQVTYNDKYTITEVKGEKTWEDANNQDRIRPASLTRKYHSRYLLFNCKFIKKVLY